ncbi:ArnT family glycosyltransferase [Tenuifilum thalassicum]|uniref:Glycosyltransferase RgtA/B/C/D-like domain-containing protein n=1 Tax=Tenuifilum thalassicum TaxID=2590900 RepID=A0A7D3XEZ2_9BACT|nr:glycosyltransferase family 39 protein [Tenuifilum thalassicum]QKG80672.1 hypothetical protein FHG85_10465 [Tenuifilum thalassicum]
MRLLNKIVRTVKNHNSDSPYPYMLFYLGLFIILFLYLGLDFIVYKGPFGVHFMRQTDSLSFASNYFNNGFHFFKPQLYTLYNFDGRAACEFPITYYLSALIYKIVGKQFYVLRFIHLVISYLGVFYTFKLSKIVIKDNVYSILISLIFFTSSVFNYYSFNYLPDAPALGFALMGWFFIIKSLDDESEKLVFPGFVFFTLSGLIKVTYLINPIAVLMLGLISEVFYKQKKLIKTDSRIVLYGFLTLLTVGFWNMYMLWYNEVNHSHSFNTKALPIWLMRKNGILQVWEYFTHYWYSSYLYKTTFHLFYLSLITLLVFNQKLRKSAAIILIFLALGSLSYFMLFFKQFKDHDYYFLAFFPLIFLVIIYSIYIYKRFITNKSLHLVAKVILLLIVAFGINHSQKKMNERLVENKIDNKFRLGLLINENKQGVDSLKIDKNAKFIVAPENCANGALLYLDRRGWAIPEVSELTAKTILDFYRKGAQYLLVADDDFSMPADLCYKQIYGKNGLRIFDLTCSK